MTDISKNVYFDVLDDIVNKYNNTVHRTIKMKPIDITDDYYLESNEDFNKKDPKLKVGDHVRISKYKNIFAKGYTANLSAEVFVINKIKDTVPWAYVSNDLNGEEIIGSFYEKESQKTSQKEFRIEKLLKRKGDKLYVKWKGYNNSFHSWINKKISLVKMSKYFSKPYNSHFGDSINVKLNLSNYATKEDIKDISHVDTSSFALKTNLANLKTEIDKLDIGKLVPIPVDLSKLSDVVKNDVVRKTEYDKLVSKVDNIDTSNFVLKTDYNNKITGVEGKIPDISNLATKTALTTVENKTPRASDLVKKTDYNNKVTEIESKLNDNITINILILQSLIL